MRSLGWPYSLWVVLFVAIETLLYLSYQHHDARFHWFLHFFVGSSTALILMAGFTYGSGRDIRWPLLWVLMGHLIAMFPDILFDLGVMAHRPWMDILLLHISAHFIPGRNWTWYSLFLVSLGLYFAARATMEDWAE